MKIILTGIYSLLLIKYRKDHKLLMCFTSCKFISSLDYANKDNIKDVCNELLDHTLLIKLNNKLTIRKADNLQNKSANSTPKYIQPELIHERQDFIKACISTYI